MPLLIDAATPGKEILHPVAVTIFGGLISATLLDTFLTRGAEAGAAELERYLVQSERVVLGAFARMQLD